MCQPYMSNTTSCMNYIIQYHLLVGIYILLKPFYKPVPLPTPMVFPMFFPCFPLGVHKKHPKNTAPASRVSCGPVQCPAALYNRSRSGGWLAQENLSPAGVDYPLKNIRKNCGKSPFLAKSSRNGNVSSIAIV